MLRNVVAFVVNDEDKRNVSTTDKFDANKLGLYHVHVKGKETEHETIGSLHVLCKLRLKASFVSTSAHRTALLALLSLRAPYEERPPESPRKGASLGHAGPWARKKKRCYVANMSTGKGCTSMFDTTNYHSIIEGCYSWYHQTAPAAFLVKVLLCRIWVMP